MRCSRLSASLLFALSSGTPTVDVNLFSLNEQESLDYIWLEKAIYTDASLRAQLRLNLGDSYVRYIWDQDFREKADALVDDPRSQIWSDVVALDLSSYPGLVDISPLAALPDLVFVSLEGTQVQDLDPLAGLTKLRKLNLNNTPVSEIGAIASLTALEWLRLENTQVVNLEPLALLVRLETLNLLGTPVENIEPLRGLLGVRNLTLQQTQVKDVVPLADLRNLRTLSLSSTRVETVRPLMQLHNLELLFLFRTPVQDVGLLAGLSNLRVMGKAPVWSPLKSQLLSINQTKTNSAESVLEGLAKLTVV